MVQPNDSERLAHYQEQNRLAQLRQSAFNELVDFVEQHGGALSGEQRDTLWNLANSVSR
jgi:hypothetical protein